MLATSVGLGYYMPKCWSNLKNWADSLGQLKSQWLREMVPQNFPKCCNMKVFFIIFLKSSHKFHRIQLQLFFHKFLEILSKTISNFAEIFIFKFSQNFIIIFQFLEKFSEIAYKFPPVFFFNFPDNFWQSTSNTIF